MTKSKAYEERLRAFIATATSWEQAYIRRWDSSASIREFPQAMWGDRDYIHVGDGGYRACECCGTKRLKVLYAVVPDGDAARVRFIGKDCLAHLIKGGAIPTRWMESLVVPGPGPREDNPDKSGLRQAQGEAHDAPDSASPSLSALSTENIEGGKSEAMIAPESLTFEPATSSIEEVWNYLCQHVPGLRESPGLGIPPNNKAGPLTYCEADLYHLIGEALSVRPVWSTCILSEYPELDICQVEVDFYAGYVAPNGLALTGQATAPCVWGDRDHQPAKQARLRAAADLLVKQGVTP